MALNREQMGLLFKLDADTKPAQQDLAAFKDFTDKLTADVGKKAAANLDSVGKSSKASAAIIKESVETISSEIIESFGVDGDIANTLGQQISGLSKATLIAGGAFVGLTAIVAGTTAALFSLAKGTAETLKEFGDLAEKSQISVETLSGLKPTLEQNGASLDKFGGAVSELQEKLVQARNGNKEFADGFKRLGVDITQGVEPALKQIVRQYSELPEGAERTAFATNVFGSAGEDLVLTLNALNGNLDANTEKMRELGLVVTPEAVKQAKEFDNQLVKLGQQFEAFKVSAGSLVIPVFTSIIEQVNGAIGSLQKLGAEFPRVSAGLKLLTLGVLSATTGAQLGQTDQQKINEDAANALAIEEDLIRRQQSGGKTDAALPFRPKPSGGRKAGSDPAATDALRLLRVQEQAAQRLADAEISEAKRAFDFRQITIEQLERLTIEAEKRMLAVKQQVFAAERAEIEKSKLRPTDKAARLAELAEREAQAQAKADDRIQAAQDQRQKIETQIFEQAAAARAAREDDELRQQITRLERAADQRIVAEEGAARAIDQLEQEIFERRRLRLRADIALTQEGSLERQKLTDELVKLEQERAQAVEAAQVRIVEAQRRDLANLRAYLQERNQLLQDVRRGEVDALNRQADQLENQAGRSPRLQGAANAARLAAQQAEAQFQNALNLQRIEADQRAAERTAQNRAQLEEIERLSNERRLQEEQRYQEQILALQAEAARQQELANPLSARSLFGDGFADTLNATGEKLQAFKSLIADFSANIAGSMKPLSEIGQQAFEGFASGIGSLVQQFVLLGTTGPAALRKLLAATLATVAAEAAVNAIKQLALGFGALFLNPPAAAAHFQSAALWGAVAAATGLAGRAIAPSSGGTGGGGGGGGGSTSAGQGNRVIEQGGDSRSIREQAQPQVIIIRAEHSPGVVVDLVRQDFQNNGVLRQTFRRDLAGES